jgi:asparagine synthase (glutamine-hydrolysing)
MSGICAVWRKDNPEAIDATLRSVSNGLSLRAGDRIEQESDAGVGVGICARFPTQQIYRNRRILIACDADLYNEAELVRLVGDREQPAGAGETASLLAALYERFGTSFVDKLRGAFSVVLWDRGKRQFLAAIDGFGLKRLAYHQDARVLLVASRIDALRRSGEIDPDINPRAIPTILNSSANRGPETIFTNVHWLAPGTLLTTADGNTRLTQYWDIRYGLGEDHNEQRLSRQLETVVEESVAAHCKGNSFAELGAFLSGGTDSSTVVGMMSRRGRGPVKAFSIGFQEQPFNELGYAELAARKFRAEHHVYFVGADDCFEALLDMVRCFDEPFGNSSAIPTYFCARLAAQHGVTTLLAGDGGDELFGGNEWYLTDKVFEAYQCVPRILRKGLIEPVLASLPFETGLVRKARGYVRRANMPPIERVLSFQFLLTHSPAEVFEGDFLHALGEYSVCEIPSRHYSQAVARDHLDRLLYTDLKIVLADSDLPKVTCMAELAGVQVRFPFLDKSVAEFSGHIPARLKVKGTQKRYLFKRAFRDLLPVEIINKKKHGFGIPVATWLKTDRRLRELARDILLSRRALERGYFRREFIADLFRKHEADNSTYYGDTVWTFLALELWHRQFVDERVGAVV